MTDESPHTDDQQTERASAAVPLDDLVTHDDLREARVALAEFMRRKALALAGSNDERKEGAEIRKVSALALSLGRIAEMEDRYAKSPDGADDDFIAWRREIRRLLELDAEERKRVLDAADRARGGAPSRGAAPGVSRGDVEGDRS